MSADKSLRERVAEALGMEEIKLHGGMPGMPAFYQFNAKVQYIEGDCPRFDTDWCHGGPICDALVDKLWFEGHEWWVEDGRGHAKASGETKLEAVCNLVLAIAAREDEWGQPGELLRGDFGLTGRHKVSR